MPGKDWDEFGQKAHAAYYVRVLYNKWRKSLAEKTVDGFDIEEPLDDELTAEELIAQHGDVPEDMDAFERDPLIIDWDAENIQVISLGDMT